MFGRRFLIRTDLYTRVDNGTRIVLNDINVDLYTRLRTNLANDITINASLAGGDNVIIEITRRDCVNVILDHATRRKETTSISVLSDILRDRAQFTSDLTREVRVRTRRISRLGTILLRHLRI